MQNRKMIIHTDRQIAEIWEDGVCIKTYPVSTAKNGIGCSEGSYCTPSGQMKIAQKIGANLPEGTVLESRRPTGAVWSKDAENPLAKTEDDLILTRILWLAGAEEDNSNTLDRYIYLHGTNQEHLLGQAASKGCIRFSNKDIIDVFDLLSEGSSVEVLSSYPQKKETPKPPTRA